MHFRQKPTFYLDNSFYHDSTNREGTTLVVPSHFYECGFSR